MSLTFADIQAAAGRIAGGKARRSPVIEVGPSRCLAGRHACSSSWIACNRAVRLRGAANTVASLPAADLAAVGHRLGRKLWPGGDPRGGGARRAGGDLSADQHAGGESR